MTLPFMPLVGIDIGPSAIKIAEMAGKGSSRKLKALGLELLPEATITDGELQDEEALETALLNLLNKLKLDPRGRRAALCVSGAAVEIKRVLVDLGDGDLDDVIDDLAEQHFQQDISDLYFRYQPLDGWSEDPKQVPVMLVGASRETIDQYIGVIRNIGMRTGVVDCSSLCMANAFTYNYPTSPNLIALVDIGAHTTNLVIICNGQFLFQKDISTGGDEYTKMISQNMGIEFDNAEAMKISACQGGISVPEEFQAVLGELNEGLSSEIQEALKLYFENSIPIPGVTGLSQMMLLGGGARLMGIESLLSNQLQVPVSILNPFNNVSVSPGQFEIDYILMQGHIFGVAIGLALRAMKDHE